MRDIQEFEAEPSLWPPILAVGTVLLGYALILLSEEQIFLGFSLIGIFLIGLVAFIVKEIITEPETKEIRIESTSFSKHTWMWIFLASEVVFFSILIGISASLRWQDSAFPVPGDTLNVPLTAINTFILICSSFTMAKAVESIEHGNQKNFQNFLVGTIALGAIFLGIQIYEYNSLYSAGFTPESGLFGATFYLQTGFHGAHVFAGLFFLSFVTMKAFRGGYSVEDHNGVLRMGMYWHFVDLVWVILFTVVYLM